MGSQNDADIFLFAAFHPILLERKVKRMKKELLARGTPEDVERAEKLRTPFQGGDRQFVSLFSSALNLR